MDLQAAGKNFVSFYAQFLRRLPRFSESVRFRHRTLDPAILFWRPAEDEKLPDSKTCYEVAGLVTVVLVALIGAAVAPLPAPALAPLPIPAKPIVVEIQVEAVVTPPPPAEPPAAQPTEKPACQTPCYSRPCRRGLSRR